MCTHFHYVPQLPSTFSSADVLFHFQHGIKKSLNPGRQYLSHFHLFVFFQVVELKPGGKDIPVTTANRIAYIHLVADYRLNKQIRAHCLAFRQGLANVVNLEWLRMFDQQEIQVAAYLGGTHTYLDLC